MGANAGNGGAIIDTAGFMVTLGSPLLHNPGLAAGVTDDGLKKMGLGTLTLDKTSTYTGTTNILAGVLQPSIQTAISGTATVNGGATLINVGPNGIYDASLVQSLNAKQTLSGTGHVTGFVTHTNLSSVITGGGVGTAGTLTFDNSLDLSGGTLRADLDQTATTYDKIVVGQSGGFSASGSPSASLVDVEFAGGTLPTAAHQVQHRELFRQFRRADGQSDIRRAAGGESDEPNYDVFERRRGGAEHAVGCEQYHPYVGCDLSARHRGRQFDLDGGHRS